MKPLSETEINEILTNNPTWELVNDGMEKTFVFSSFMEASERMYQLAKAVNSLNHHPELKNVYRTVEVRITTHDLGALSNLDVKLLKLVNQYFDA